MRNQIEVNRFRRGGGNDLRQFLGFIGRVGKIRQVGEETEKNWPQAGWDGFCRAGGQFAERKRYPANALPDGIEHEVTVVTAKEFVAAIARETDGNVPPRQLRNQKGGDLRGISKGFVVEFR